MHQHTTKTKQRKPCQTWRQSHHTYTFIYLFQFSRVISFALSFRYTLTFWKSASPLSLNLYLLLICFWLCWVFAAVRVFLYSYGEWGLPCICGVQASHCEVLLLQGTGCRRIGFSSCGSQDLQHRLNSCDTWPMGSSKTRAQTHVSCIGRRILYHGATGEAPITISLLTGHTYTVFSHLLFHTSNN